MSRRLDQARRSRAPRFGGTDGYVTVPIDGDDLTLQRFRTAERVIRSPDRAVQCRRLGHREAGLRLAPLPGHGRRPLAHCDHVRSCAADLSADLVD